jgi:hypothetical protein
MATTPEAPLANVVKAANASLVVFRNGTIENVADIINPPDAPGVLYVDIVTDAAAGSATSIPIGPGQAYRVSSPINAPVSVTSKTAGHAFVAVRY